MAVGQVAHAPVIVAPSTSWVYGLALHDGQDIAPKTAEQTGWMLHGWSAEKAVSPAFSWACEGLMRKFGGLQKS